MHLTLPFSFFLSSSLLQSITLPIEAEVIQTQNRRLRSKSDKSLCKHGYKMDETLKECVDINECEDRNVCGTYNTAIYILHGHPIPREFPSGTCSNTEGGYECDCLEGTYYDAVSKKCIETNECVEEPDICIGGVCKNIPNGYICECVKGYWHTQIYNQIEKSCSNPACGDLDFDDDIFDYELTGNTCGGEEIGKCEAKYKEYSAECNGLEAHCSCEQGYKKVNFYDPVDPQYGRNTFPTCIDDSECIGQEHFCTCQEGFQLDYTTHKCVPIVCDDIDTFIFPLINFPNKEVHCAWISTNSQKADARREKYCNDTHIAAACPNACNKCGVYKDSPSFTFELLNPDEDGNTVVQDCAWIAKNPNAIDDRREKYCFATDDCTKASDIGDHCPEACGFTEGLHWNRSC